jgi:prolyl-tRNA editing enzyme YbaK/EbsC (Cys-tRNA(Pro) deacylase)
MSRHSTTIAPDFSELTQAEAERAARDFRLDREAYLEAKSAEARAVAAAQLAGTHVVQLEQGEHVVFVVHYSSNLRISSKPYLTYNDARRALFRLV